MASDGKAAFFQYAKAWLGLSSAKAYAVSQEVLPLLLVEGA